VRVAGDRVANDGGVLRKWALKGRGVIVKNHWGIRNEIESGVLATALDAFVAQHVDVYAVLPGGIPSRRVGALIDFFAEGLRGADRPRDDQPASNSGEDQTPAQAVQTTGPGE
jgi:DNA-binding transcriptional LysR family regulator